MEKIKQLLKHPMTLIFGLLIVGIFIWDNLYPIREFSDMENRALTKKPAFSVKSLMAEGDQSYTMKYEKYVNDQFVLRDQWISLKSRSEFLLGKTENNGVIYGKDHYMFEKYFSTDEERLGKNTAFVKEFGDKYADQTTVSAMLIPYSYEALEDKVPAGLAFVDQVARTKEIYGELEKSGIKTLDIFPTMSEHRDEYIYYRTDHHWTTQGAYYAYRQFCESRGRKPVELSQLTGHEVKDFYGTFFSKSKAFNTVPDVISYYDFSTGKIVIDGKETEGLYAMEKFDERDKYGAFLHGNNGLTVLRSGEVDRPGDGSRILVVKDSFGNCFTPFLLRNYDEVWVVDLRYLKEEMSAIMSENHFDDVLILYGFVSFDSYPSVSKITY
ncbi:DHHW family protein [Zongyangia hominis]|nr:DHHW family protein [Zongyangia hominis]